MKFLRLGSAGMRGEIGTGLTPDIIIDFASAMGTYLEGGKIVIGRDTRFSSKMLYNAAVSALLSCGCQVIDAGICPAPLLHFAVPHIGADAGLLLGAGHHPSGWNALVPLNATGAYFNAIQTQELLDVYHSKKYLSNTWNNIGSETPIKENIPKAYLDKLFEQIDIDSIRSRQFNVITDFCNGSGSLLSQAFAERLKLNIIPINDTKSGILPHDPEPRPRSSSQVKSIINVLNADIGFVFNSDMSRTAVVSSSGETLSEEYTFPLAADQYLRRSTTAKSVVTNWCTTRTLDETVLKHNGTIDKTKVGQAPIIDRMLELGAGLAGDGSGSVALNNSVFGFDSYIAMTLILEAMAQQQCSSAELAEQLPRYHIIKRKISCPSAHAYTMLKHIKSQFPDADITEEDGLRFDWSDGWIHLRASVTEPIIRMIVEWKNREDAETKAIQVRGLLERLVAS